MESRPSYRDDCRQGSYLHVYWLPRFREPPRGICGLWNRINEKFESASVDLHWGKMRMFEILKFQPMKVMENQTKNVENLRGEN